MGVFGVLREKICDVGDEGDSGDDGGIVCGASIMLHKPGVDEWRIFRRVDL